MSQPTDPWGNPTPSQTPPPQTFYQQPNYPQQFQQQGLWNPSGVYGGIPEPKKGMPWWGTAIILVLALGIVVTIGAVFRANEPKTTNTQNQSNPVQVQTQPTKLPNLSPIPTRTVFGLTVNNQYLLPNIQTRIPQSGYVYYIADFTITNNSTKSMLVSPLYFTVQSDKAYSYEPQDVTFLLQKQFQSTTLAPGEITRGEIAFEIPIDETIVTAKFADMYGNRINIQVK